MKKDVSANKRKSGGRSLTDYGKKPVLIGLTADQHDLIARAAAAEVRPITQFLTFHGLVAAKKILENQTT